MKKLEDLLIWKKLTRFDLENLLIAALLLIFSEWVPDIINNMFRGDELSPWLRFGVGGAAIVIWLCLLAVAVLRGRQYLRPRQLHAGQCSPSKCLLLFVSTVNDNYHFPEVISHPLNITLVEGDAEKEVKTLVGQSIDADIAALKFKGPFFSWQQMLRVIQGHIRTAERVVLIGSTDKVDKGTYGLLEDRAIPFIRPYFSKSTQIRAASRAVDFENFADLMYLINEEIEKLVREENYEHHEILIDVTGGQKTASIAAAMCTLNNRVRFQYISTLKPDFKCTSYDVESSIPGKVE